MVIKLLTLTTLYPNREEPHHGIFVENRLRHLCSGGKVVSKVVAPVPWFPFKAECLGAYSKYARVEKTEIRHGVEVLHPRYVVFPKVGMSIAPVLLAVALFSVIKKIIKDGYDFDVIDAHYYYPDGVAAAILGKLLKKKVVITARGSDIHSMPCYQLPRKMILWASENSDASIVVCNALGQELNRIGAKLDSINVIRNGVDLSLFSPLDNRRQVRKKLGVEEGKYVALSVGRLVSLKGHHLTIEAVSSFSDLHLYIAGEGPEEKKLRLLAQKLEVEDRVTFLGRVQHKDLNDYYNAADLTILASSKEGWANVLLESMSCGTPVVATNTGGTPEVVTDRVAGVLIQDRTAQSIAKSIRKLFDFYPDRTLTRQYAEQFSWNETSEKQLALLRKITGKK